MGERWMGFVGFGVGLRVVCEVGGGIRGSWVRSFKVV